MKHVKTFRLSALVAFMLLCTFSLRAQVPPANDSLCNATPLIVGAGCTVANGDLTAATVETNEVFGNCTFSPPTNSVWYSFVAPATGLVIISTNHPGLATIEGMDMTLYQMSGSLCSLDSLTAITCNSSESQGESLPTIAAELTPGNTYYIQVTGDVDFLTSISQTGTFCIAIEELQLPVNDQVCNAIQVELDSAAIPFHNVGATSVFEFAIAPPLDPTDIFGFNSWGLNFFITRSIWFTFVAPPSGTVEIDLSDLSILGNFNSKIALYSATDCNDLSTFNLILAQESSRAPSGAAGFQIVFQNYLAKAACLTPGETYYLLVDGSGDLLGNTTNAMGRGLISINSVTLDPLSLLPEDNTIFNPFCSTDSNGAIVALASGGADANDNGNLTSTLSYEWSTGETSPFLKNIAPGTYTLTVTDDCDTTTSMTYEVTGGEGAELTATADTQVCAGDMVPLSVMIEGGRPMDTQRAYVAAASGSSFGPIGGQILTFDPGNFLTADTVTTDTLPRFLSLAYANGQLFALSKAGQIFTIDPLTGAYSLVDTLSGDIGTELITSIDYNPAEGRMEGISNSSRLYSINLTTTNTTFLDSVPTINLGQMSIDTAGGYYFTDQSNSGFVTALETQLMYYTLGDTEVDTLETFEFPDGSVTAMALDPRDNNVYFLNNRRVLNLPSTSMTHHEMYRWDVQDSSFTPVVLMEELPGSDVYYSLAFGPATVEPFSYIWSPTTGLNDPNSAQPLATVDTTTTYTVTVMDACGMTTDSVTVTVDMPSLSLGSTPDNGNSNGSATASVSGGVSPYTYLWSNGGATETIDNLVAGTYTVVATDALGCNSTDSVVVQSNVSIDELSQAGINRWEVFPNPAHSEVQIRVELSTIQKMDLQLYSSVGQLILHEQLDMGNMVETALDVSKLPPGIYLLTLKTTQGQAWQRVTIR